MKAKQIVDRLLETDDPLDAAVNPEQYLHQYADQLDKDEREGNVTPKTALTASTFWHRTLTYKDGVTPIQVRRNGRTQTWKTRPSEFRVPVKYGMYDYFNITPQNAHEWSTVPLPPKAKPPKTPKKRSSSPSNLMPPL